MNPTEEHTYRENVVEKLDDLKLAVEKVDAKVTYTNGKVRKITVALILLSGIVIGQNFTSAKDIVSLFVSIIH